MVDQFCFCHNYCRNVKQILNYIMFNSNIFTQHIVHEKHNS